MLARNIKKESRFVEAIDLFLQDLKDSGSLLEAIFARLKKSNPKINKGQYNRVLKRLEDSERIRIIERDGKLFIQLTKKGRLRVLLRKIDLLKQKKWDGKWRLMIWDIPESSKKQRNAIRRFVKRLGFSQLQKSVYITPFELSKDAVDYLVESGLWKFIRFLRVDRLDHDRAFKKYFGLTATQ